VKRDAWFHVCRFTFAVSRFISPVVAGISEASKEEVYHIGRKSATANIHLVLGEGLLTPPQG